MAATVTLDSANIDTGGTRIFLEFNTHGNGALVGAAVTGLTITVNGVARAATFQSQTAPVEYSIFLTSPMKKTSRSTSYCR